MSIAINIEQSGSAIIHPNIWIKPDDIMTPTLPRVSAKMCKKTPENKNKSTQKYYIRQ